MANDSHADFVLESREHLQVFERSMLALERGGDAQNVRECIDASLRAIHSLKGNAGFLGFHAIQKLAHAIESVLENFRNQSVAPPVSVVETILVANDRLASMIDDLHHSQSYDISGILKSLHAFDNNSVHIKAPEELATLRFSLQVPKPPASILPLFECFLSLSSDCEVQLPAPDLQRSVEDWGVAKELIVVHLTTDRSIVQVRERLMQCGMPFSLDDFGAVELVGRDKTSLEEQLLSRQGKLVYEPANLSDGIPTPPILWIAQSSNEASELEQRTQTMSSLDSIDEALVAKSVEIPIAKHEVVSKNDGGNTGGDSVSERTSSLRIQVELLDRLMNLVSELTLVRNQSMVALGETDGAPQAFVQRLNTVTSELQETVLRTRMQPVGNLFGRFPRMVRDLARQLGKQVELDMVGQEVELDKTVLEQLSDPLTHLIRNSIDHGLEAPAKRLQVGKSMVGHVTLSATAADGQVIIEVRDDGRGIDPEAIRAKLVARGIKNETELQKISLKELYSYILLPGFSTAKELSDVSGRGVGMDVVKTNIERLQGSLIIDSIPGTGTTMTLRVPLTLAIIPCLIVTSDEHRFAIPQRGLEEIVCLHPGGNRAIEHTYDTEVYRLRELLLPIVRLRSVLAFSKPFTASTKAAIMAAHPPASRDSNAIEYILVLRSGGRKFGLLVDDVRGTEEIVVKPMHPSLKKIGIFSGATLMGDGRVVLIANIDGIAEHAGCHGVEPPSSLGASKRDPAEVHRVLLFEYGPQEQFALPLVQIRRIESIAMDQVEWVGDQAFITIDGTSTRIIQLDKYLKVSECELLPTMHLLLPKFVAQPIGILISKIVDTDSLSIQLQQTSIDDPGILGTAVIRGRLSLFLDTQYLRERLFEDQTALLEEDSELPSVHENRLTEARTPRAKRLVQHILLVDDTSFFREVVKRYFEREGLQVTTAVDGIDGLRKLAEGVFDLVVSDIEMPNLDGWRFCEKARKLGYTTPFLALTSLSKHEHSKTAIECGFDGFEEKLDHDRLIASVMSMLGSRHKEVHNE